MFQSRPDINKNFIFTRLGEEDIFNRYLGIYPKLKVDYKNPLRKDEFETCQFYRDTRNILKFKDFAKRWNWDCINVVEYIYNVKYQEALNIIAKDFGLIKGINTITPEIRIYKEKNNNENIKNEFKIKTQNWTNTDIKYWKSWGINSNILKKYQVYSVLVYWINNKLRDKYHHNDPIYAYYFDNGEYKLYFPMRNKKIKGGRFRQNCTGILQGYKQLPEKALNLVITKSLKDVMCLDLFNISAVAPLSESILLTRKQHDDLSFRFTNIYSLMDNDNTGKRMAIMLKQLYNITPLMFNKEDKKEGIKDFSDHIKIRGINETIDLVKYIKDYG